MRALLLFLLISTGLCAQESIYKKGVVNDSLKISDTIPGTYSLFLPSEFDGKTEFPVIFIFDPEGRGISAARLFRDAAEKQNYVLVSSNNVDPSRSLKENLASAAYLIQSVGYSLPIDVKSISVAGLGEGAQIATAMPLVFEGIHGIIYVGDQYFNLELLQDRPSFASVGIVGNQQINIGDLETADYMLKSIGFPSQLYVFEGGLEWPVTALLSSAVGSLTLHAMDSGKRTSDASLINQLYEEDLQLVNQMMSTDKYILARKFLDELLIKYDDVRSTREVKDKLKQLNKSKNFKEQQREYEEMIVKEQRLVDDFLFYYNEDVEKANFENLGWWNYQKLQMMNLTKGENKSEAAMGYRLLEMLAKMSQSKIASFEEDDASLEVKLMANMLATVFDQQDFEAYKRVISLSTLDADYATALFYLEEMLKNGYDDLDALYEIEGTLGLKISREYNWLLKKYLGRSRYFENATSL